jgi:hypothetical protein
MKRYMLLSGPADILLQLFSGPIKKIEFPAGINKSGVFCNCEIINASSETF